MKNNEFKQSIKPVEHPHEIKVPVHRESTNSHLIQIVACKK